MRRVDVDEQQTVRVERLERTGADFFHLQPLGQLRRFELAAFESLTDRIGARARVDGAQRLVVRDGFLESRCRPRAVAIWRSSDKLRNGMSQATTSVRSRGDRTIAV